MDIHRLRVVRFSNSNNAEKASKPTIVKKEISQIVSGATGDGAAQKQSNTSGHVRGSTKSGTALRNSNNTTRLGRKSKSDTIIIPQKTKVFQLGTIFNHLGYRKATSLTDIKKRLTQKRDQCSYFIGQTLLSFTRKKESTAEINKKRKQCLRKNKAGKQDIDGSLSLKSKSKLNSFENVGDSKSNSQNLDYDIMETCPEKKSSHAWFGPPMDLQDSETNCSKSLNNSVFQSHFNVVNFSCSKVDKNSSTRLYQVNLDNMNVDGSNQQIKKPELHVSEKNTRCDKKIKNDKIKKKKKKKAIKCKKLLKSSKKHAVKDPTQLICFRAKPLEKLQNILAICKDDEILSRRVLKYIFFSIIVVAWCPCVAAIGFGWLMSQTFNTKVKKKWSKKCKASRKKKVTKTINECKCNPTDLCCNDKKRSKKLIKSLTSCDTGNKPKTRTTECYAETKNRTHVRGYNPFCYDQLYQNMFVQHKGNPLATKNDNHKVSNHPVMKFTMPTKKSLHENIELPCRKTRFQNFPFEHKLTRYYRPELSVEHRSVAMRGRPVTRNAKLGTKRSRSAVEGADLTLKDTQQPLLRSSSEPRHQLPKVINSCFPAERKRKIKQNNRDLNNHPKASAEDYFLTEPNNRCSNSLIKGQSGERPKVINHCYVTSRNQSIPIGGYYFSDPINQCCFESPNACFGKKILKCKCAGNQTKCCGGCNDKKQKLKVDRQCKKEVVQKPCKEVKVTQCKDKPPKMRTKIVCLPDCGVTKSGNPAPPCRGESRDAKGRLCRTLIRCKCPPKRLFLQPEECVEKPKVCVPKKIPKRCTRQERLHTGSGDGDNYDRGVRKKQVNTYKSKDRSSQSSLKLKKFQKPMKNRNGNNDADNETNVFDKDDIFTWIRTTSVNIYESLKYRIKQYISDCYAGNYKDDKVCQDLFHEKDSCYKLCKRCPSCYACWIVFRKCFSPICDCIVMCLASCSWCPLVCCYLSCCCICRIFSTF